MKFVSVLLCIWLTEADAFATTSFLSHRPSYHAMIEQRAEHTAETRAESPITTKGTVLTSRPVARVETFARLPVWPVVNGVFLWMIQQLFGAATAAEWEDRITGRVCPNFFAYQESSPFVMLVHHCHSFAAWDLIRYLQATFFPEGFPSQFRRSSSNVW
jgi:hypothetical protein